MAQCLRVIEYQKVAMSAVCVLCVCAAEWATEPLSGC